MIISVEEDNCDRINQVPSKESSEKVSKQCLSIPASIYKEYNCPPIVLLSPNNEVTICK